MQVIYCPYAYISPEQEFCLVCVTLKKHVFICTRPLIPTNLLQFTAMPAKHNKMHWLLSAYKELCSPRCTGQISFPRPLFPIALSYACLGMHTTTAPIPQPTPCNAHCAFLGTNCTMKKIVAMANNHGFFTHRRWRASQKNFFFCTTFPRMCRL